MATPQPNAYPVKITVDSKGNFTYSPSFIVVKQGDQIKFSTDDGNHFSVMFKGLSPGDRIRLDNNYPLLTIDPEAPYGVYHYASAVFDGTQVRLDSGCGDVGVEN